MKQKQNKIGMKKSDIIKAKKNILFNFLMKHNNKNEDNFSER